MLICPNKDCKHENPDGSKFCRYCGTKLEKEVTKIQDNEPLSDNIKQENRLNNSNKMWSSIKKQERQIKKIDKFLFKKHALKKGQYIRCHLYCGDIFTEKASQAYNKYLECALRGNSVAENAIGMFYETGIYVSKDLLKAKEWYQRSANHNCFYGYNNLALIYLNGEGCEKDIDKAIELLQISANSGYAQSQLHLAEVYYYEKEHKDYAKALFWLQKAAHNLNLSELYFLLELYDVMFEDPLPSDFIAFIKRIAPQNTSASNFIGMIYAIFDEIPDNLKKAKRNIKKGLRKNNAESIFTLGKFYYENWIPDTNYSNAIKYFEKALNQGEFSGAYMLGDMYQYGKGFPIDYSKSIKFHEFAASNGITASNYSLGCIYQDGKGVEKDEKRAFDYFTLAAKRMHVPSLDALGDCFNYGIGTEIDIDKAIDCYTKAAELGNTSAMSSLSYIYEKPEKRNEELALKYAKMAAEREDSTGLNNYAFALENGFSGNQDISKAITYYSKACYMNNAVALKNLGYLYVYKLKDYCKAKECIEEYLSLSPNDGNALYVLGGIYQYGPEKIFDINKAKELYEKALEIKEYLAAEGLGDIYFNGHGIEKDYTKSIFFYEIASKKGIPRASYQLGFIFEYGLGVNKDIQTAVKYYTKSANEGNGDALYTLGNIYFEGKDDIIKDPNLAIEFYEKASSLGNDTASLKLCEIFTEGEHVDLQKAIYYADTAANSGEYDGYIYLGIAFENGVGCKIDYDRAVEFYTHKGVETNEFVLEHLIDIFYTKNNFTKVQEYIEKLLEINPNNPFAFYIKGCLYGNGYGTEIDYKKSFFYHEKAASLGYDISYFVLGIMYASGTGCEKDLDKALECFDKVPEKNDGYLSYFIGLIYYGKGDLKTAEYYLKKSIEEEGPVDAYNILGGMYLYEDSVEKNYIKANELLMKAIHKYDDSDSKYEIGYMHLGYYGTEPNYQKAKELFQQVIKQNNCKGYIGLGLLSELGFDTDNPIEDAIKYYKMAAEDPDTGALFYLANAYRSNQEYEKAKACYLNSLSSDIKLPSAACDLASMLEYDMNAENGYNEIIKYYKLALQIDPDNTSVCENLTRLFANNHKNVIDNNNSYIISKSFKDARENIFDHTLFLNNLVTKNGIK